MIDLYLIRQLVKTRRKEQEKYVNTNACSSPLIDVVKDENHLWESLLGSIPAIMMFVIQQNEDTGVELPVMDLFFLRFPFFCKRLPAGIGIL